MSTVAEPKTLNKSNVDTNGIYAGDVFSEISHYTFIGEVSKGQYKFRHHESGKEIVLDTPYVSNLLSTADQFKDTVIVGKEDKFWTQKQIDVAKIDGTLPLDVEVREGDLKQAGIRTIFENIFSSEVFTVCFVKADKKLSDKKYKEALEKQRTDAVARIEAASKGKKGVAAEALKVIEELQKNTIVQIEPGEERKLRGYKVQFSSRDGNYEVVDMDYPDGQDKPNLRKVNINTIKWIVFKGTKFVVE